MLGRLKRVLTFLTVVLLALIAFAQFIRRTSMFFPERYPLGNCPRARRAIIRSVDILRRSPLDEPAARCPRAAGERSWGLLPGIARRG